MEYRCTKVRPSQGAYTAEDGKASPMRSYEAHFTPLESQHGEQAGVAGMKVWFWNTCPVEEGQVYDLPDFVAKRVEYVLVKK